MAIKPQRWRGILLALAALVLVQAAGCTATRARRGEPERSGFLGDYSRLAASEDYPAALVYVDPTVDWSRYSAIHLDSVGLWATEGTAGLNEADRQKLTDILFTSIHGQLAEVFELADAPGPETLRLRIGLTQVHGANVPLRTVTTVIPQTRLLGGAVGLAGDTASLVGSATVEIEILDSVTHRRLAAAVDQRAGTKVLFAKRAYTTWGDVAAACEHWSQRIVWQLARHGVRRKAGVRMPEEPAEPRSF